MANRVDFQPQNNNQNNNAERDEISDDGSFASEIDENIDLLTVFKFAAKESDLRRKVTIKD